VTGAHDREEAKMRPIRIGLLIGFLVLILNFAGTAVAMTTYDTFNGPMINYTKWDSQELIREIRLVGGNNKLVSKVSGYGTSSSNFLYVKNPGGIYYLEAIVTLTAAEAQFDSTHTTYASAGLAGVFYNDGTAGSGSVGDVMAQIRLEKSGGTIKAKWYIIRYISADGSAYETVDSGLIGGTILLSQPYKLSIKFDPPINTFTFTVGANPHQKVVTGTTNTPKSDWKALRTSVQPPTGYWGNVSATFDNVKAQNQSGVEVLADDFESSLNIDTAKWSPNLELFREIENSHLRLKYKRINLTANAGNALPFSHPEMINEIQARVSLSVRDKTAPDTALQARIAGYFLNSTGSPNYEGEIYAAVYLGVDKNEDIPKAGWYVTQFQDANNNTIIANGTLLSRINLEEAYTLYLRWDGNQFTFGCSGAPDAHYTPTAVHPSNIKYKDLSVRIIPATSPNDSTISATFDDVQTDILNLYLPLILKF
jgi:hypothetical protein